eukprot:c10978_g3_i1.p1 GENE.c10978_g3_i1~~c10978_g3_i1.p1  ORF type:complete len:1491 (+),score=126.92 c10978_g3_i1:284-4474(+)
MSAFAADLDGDGAIDVVVAAFTDDSIAWFRNNGSGGFHGPAVGISNTSDGVTSVFAADLDDFVSVDVVAASQNDNTIAWFKNNGTGSFGAKQVISASAMRAMCVFAGDLDNTGSMDVLSASQNDNTIAWFRNDGSGLFSAMNVITNSAMGAKAVSAADLDGSGTLDVLAASSADGTMAWYRNNGTGGFGGPFVITSLAPGVRSVVAGDISNDGILDVVWASPTLGAIAWHRSFPDLAAHPIVRLDFLPIECAGLHGRPACLAASIIAVSSACFPSLLELHSNVTGCFESPFSVGGIAALTISTESSSSQVFLICDVPVRRSLFVVPSGGSLSLTNLTVLIGASVTPLHARSLLSVCDGRCTASDSATLLLRDTEIYGFANVGSFKIDPLHPDLTAADYGFGAILVHGASFLSISKSIFGHNACESIGAAISIVGKRASVSIVESRFANNTAAGKFSDALGGGGGGAIAVAGADVQVYIENSSFWGNAAPNGDGGAVLVLDSASDANVVCHACTFSYHTAGVRGGVVAVGAPRSSVSLSDCMIDHCEAEWGGALAAFSTVLAGNRMVSSRAAALMPRGRSKSGEGTVVLSGVNVLLNARAQFGGIAFVCAALINLSNCDTSSWSSFAVVAGGFAFFCNPEDSVAVGGPSDWLFVSPPFSGASRAGYYGDVLATPSLGFDTSLMPAATTSGAPIGGVASVRLLDLFGQIVDSPGLLVRLEAASSSDTLATSMIAACKNGVFAASSLVLTMARWPLDQVASIVHCSVVGGENLLWTAKASVSVNVRPCPAGLGRASPDDGNTPLICTPCSIGKVSSLYIGMAADSSGIASTGYAECSECPSNSLPRIDAHDATLVDCECIPGYYTLLLPGRAACQLCPAGASCSGNMSAPTSLAGFFMAGPESFLKCPLPGACLSMSVCAPGYEGFLCRRCARGHFADSQGRCSICPEGARGRFALYIIVLVGGTLLAVVLLILAARKGLSSEEVVSVNVLRSRTVPPTLSMTVQALQIVGILALAPLTWPSGAQRALTIFNVFSLDMNIFASECTLTSFGAKYAMSMASGGVCLIILVLISGALRLLHCCGGAFGALPNVTLATVLLSTLFSVGPLVYLPLARATLVLFDCRALPGLSGFWLKASLGERCFDANWWRLFPVGLLGLLVYVIGIPGLISVTLRRHRLSLFTQPSVFHLYGSVYKLVRRPYYWLSIVLMGKKLGIAAASLFLSRSPAVLVAVLLVVIGGAGLAQSSVKPFYYTLYNRLDLALTVLLSALLVCGMVLYADRGGSPNLSALVVVLIYVTLSTLLLVVLGFVLCDIRAILIDRRTVSGQIAKANIDNGKARGVATFEQHTRNVLRRLILDIEDPGGFLQSMLSVESIELTAAPASVPRRNGGIGTISDGYDSS